MESVIRRLQETAAELADELTAVTDTQWNWQPAAGSWTVQQNVEHLILVEHGVLRLIRAAMLAPPAERGAPLTDDEVWTRLTRPNGRTAEAPERVRPSGRFPGRAEAMAEFTRLRQETIAYAATTADPLRQRWVRMPAGELDGVQALLMLAAHCRRHLGQIRALRGLPAFPSGDDDRPGTVG
jgi:uncharacterized damage-inducible protein DinB